MSLPTYNFGLTVRYPLSHALQGQPYSGCTNVQIKKGETVIDLDEIGSTAFYFAANVPAGKWMLWVNNISSGQSFGIGEGELAGLGYEAGKTLQSQASSIAWGLPTASWDAIADKPTTFTPSTHGHAMGDVSGLLTALNGKAASSHTHAIADVSLLQSTIEGINTALGQRALDSNVMHLAGNETATGTKTLVDGLRTDSIRARTGNLAFSDVNGVARASITASGFSLGSNTVFSADNTHFIGTNEVRPKYIYTRSLVTDVLQTTSGIIASGGISADYVKTPLITNDSTITLLPSVADKLVYTGRTTASASGYSVGSYSYTELTAATPSLGFGSGQVWGWRTASTPAGAYRHAAGIYTQLTAFTDEANYEQLVGLCTYARRSGASPTLTPLTIESDSTTSANGRLNIKAGITTFSGMANGSTYSLLRIADSTNRLIISAAETDAIPYAQTGTNATGGARLHLNGNGYSSGLGNCEVYLGSNANGTGNFTIRAAQPGSTSTFNSLRCSQTSFELTPDNVTSFGVDATTTHVYKDLAVDGASTLQGILTMSGTAVRSADANYTIPETATCLVNTAGNTADRSWTLPTPWLGRILILANNAPSGSSGNIIVQAKSGTYLHYNTTITLFRYATSGRKGLILLGVSSTQWVIVGDYTL